MKKFFENLPLLVAVSVASFFAACSNSSSSVPIIPIPRSPSYFSQDSLSHRAYIGGSLIYNPDNSSLSQISSGSKIAVRTSALEKKSETLYQISNQSDLRKNVEISVDSDGSWTGGAPKTFDNYIVEKEGSEVFGYITISAISKDSISISYKYYATANSGLSSQNFTIKLGESKKLGSSASRLTYETPKIARKGFENSRWLTFENSEETMSACMFSSMPEVNGKQTSNLYGVNSDNDFIYLVGDRDEKDNYYPTDMPAKSEMVSYGDYIIDQNDGKMYAIVGDTSGGYDNVMKDVDDYDSTTSSTEDFMNFAYYVWQFPDPRVGPQALFQALPQGSQTLANEALKNSTENEIDLYIRKLNWCLCSKKSFDYIINDLTQKKQTSDANAIKEAVEELYDNTYKTKVDEWRDKIANGDSIANIEDPNELEVYIEAMRNFLDEIYDESPDAYIDAPTVFNAYPDMALELGGDECNTFDYSASNVIPSVFYSESSKTFEHAKKYNEYVQKRDKLVKKFSEFHQLELAKVNGKNMNTYGVNFAFGVKGKIVKNLGIKSGEFGIKGLGAAVFLKAEASMQSALKTQDTSFFDDETKKKMEKNLFEPIKFSLGPIPCIFKTTFKFDFGYKAAISTNIKYMAGITALAGGEMDMGAQWGVDFKWKVVPVGGYFKPWPTNSKSFDDAVFYVGPADAAPDKSPGLDVGVYISGTLTPQVGIGVEYICAGLQVPAKAQPEVHYIIDNKFMEQYKTMQHLKGLLCFTVDFGPFFEVTIPVIGKKVKAEWKALTIINRGGDKAIEIFDVPL